jgi:hypothetical protein
VLPVRTHTLQEAATDEYGAMVESLLSGKTVWNIHRIVKYNLQKDG